MEEVQGSSPCSSTKIIESPVTAAFCFMNIESSATLDSFATLPSVDLVSNPEAGISDALMVCSIVHEGEPVGTVDIVLEPDVRQAYFGFVRLHEGKTGQGFGTSAYLAAAGIARSYGFSFRSDPVQVSQGAYNVWERLVAAGLAEIIEDFVPVEQDGRVAYFGHVRMVDGTKP
jgi:hypothetical protein